MAIAVEEAVSRAESHPASPFVVTLIHGTYAEGAEWTRPETSKLCTFLTNEFKSRVRFDRLDWKPPNRHKARYLASQQLAKTFRNKSDRFGNDDIPHFIIGHSHGGTAIAYAIRDDPRFAQSLDGIAFLSTPFIQARERSAPRWILKALPRVVGLITVIIFGMAALLALRLSEVQPQYAGGILLGVLAGSALLAHLYRRRFQTFIGSPEDGLPPRLQEAARRAASQLDLGSLAEIREKTLIIRTNGDEASSWLAAGHLGSRVLSELPARVAHAPTWLGGYFDRWTKRARAKLRSILEPPAGVRQGPAVRAARWVLCAGMVALIVACAIGLWLGDARIEATWPAVAGVKRLLTDIFVNGVTLAAWTTLFLALLSVTLAILAIPLIALVLRVTFGRWVVLAGLFVEFSVETTPPGNWHIHQLDLCDAPEPDFTSPFGLAHSISYDDPRAHRIIAEWIRERLAVQATAPTAA